MCFARGGHGGGHCGGHSSGHSISTISSKSNIGIRNSSRINSNTSLANSRGSRDTYFDNINRNSIAFQLISHIFSLIPILFFIFMCAPNEFYEKFIQYKRNRININCAKYINKFLIKFSNINNIPKWNDIEFFYKHFKEQIIIDEVLIPLIINKINNINEMNLREQYNFYYIQNIDQIDLFQLNENTILFNEIRYKIQESNKINNLLKNNKYLDLRVTILIDQTDSNYDVNYMRIKHIAVIYFNQKAILKKIVLDVFLNEDNDIEFIRNDILKQIKDYHNNKIIYLNNNKIQLLINAIKENINENPEFKEKFIAVFNKTFMTHNNH